MPLVRPARVVALLVLSSLGTPGLAQSPEPWTESDAEGDSARLTDLGPSLPVREYTDILGMRIEGEDELGLSFNLTFKELSVDPSREPNNQVSISVAFEVEGFTTGLQADAYLSAASNDRYDFDVTYTGEAFLRVCSSEGHSCFGGGLQPRVDVYDGPNSVRLWIPKASIANALARQAEDEGEEEPGVPGSSGPPPVPDLRAGTKLKSFRVEAGDGPDDTMPDDGTSAKAYTMAFGAVQFTISLWISGGYGDGSYYAPGESKALQMGVMAPPGPRRMIRLKYVVDGPEGFRAEGPANLSLGGGRIGFITFNLFAPPSEAGAELTIEATAYPTGERGIGRLTLRPGTPLGPNVTGLQFMHRPNPAAQCSLTACVTDGVLTTRASVPGYSGSGWMGSHAMFGSEVGFELELDRRTVYPLAWDKGKEVEVKVKLAAVGYPRMGIKVHATLGPHGGFFGGPDLWLDKEVELDQLGTEGEVLTFKAVPKRPRFIVPSGSPVELAVKVEETAVVPAYMDPSWMPRYALDVAESSVTLPLTHVPTEFVFRPNPSPFQMHVVGERSVFVQPGEARLFNVTVLNQNASEQRLTLEPTALTPGWSAEVQPGSEFLLQPGDAVLVGLVLHAPREAPEAQVGRVRLNATALNAEAVPLLVEAIVAAQIESPDEAHVFKANPEDAAKQVGPTSKGSPGPTAFGALVVAGLVAFLVGRRRAL